MEKLKRFLILVGPGLFLLGYNIGTGSVTTMAKVGADYGMALLWPLLLSCIFFYVLIIAFGDFTLATGLTGVQGIRKFFGKPFAVFTVAALIGSELLSVMGVMGIVTGVLNEYMGINRVLSAAFFIVLLYVLFLNGNQSFFEKILTLLVGVMAGSFIVSLFVSVKEPVAVLKTLTPYLPSDNPGFIKVCAMVGTTLCAAVVIVRSILVKDKGWTKKDRIIVIRDARVSVIMMFVLSAVIMACAAGTMHVLGLKVVDVMDMVNTLKGIGRIASPIFVLGIVGAGLSSIFPVMMLGPWLICDYMGKERNATETWFRVFVACILLSGLFVPLFGGKPVAIMIMTQAFATFVNPVVFFFILYVFLKKGIMGEYAVPAGTKVTLALAFVFSLYISILAIRSFPSEIVSILKSAGYLN
jgi:Mn2+/Fe2+ NRAMP family transporter